MASHHQRDAEILPFVRDERIARGADVHPDLIEQLREAGELRRREVDRKLFWQALIEWLCVALVIAATIYFSVQSMRPHFNQAASSNLARSTH